MSLLDWIPGAGILLVGGGYFVMTLISPLCAVVSLALGAILKNLEWAIAGGAVAGIGYQFWNIHMWGGLPGESYNYFLLYGTTGAALAGMAWSVVGNRIRAYFSRR